MWAHATPEEAIALFQALLAYLCPEDDVELWNLMCDVGITPQDDPGWHCHIGDADELTLAIHRSPEPT